MIEVKFIFNNIKSYLRFLLIFNFSPFLWIVHIIWRFFENNLIRIDKGHLIEVKFESFSVVSFALEKMKLALGGRLKLRVKVHEILKRRCSTFLHSDHDEIWVMFSYSYKLMSLMLKNYFNLIPGRQGSRSTKKIIEKYLNQIENHLLAHL